MSIVKRVKVSEVKPKYPKGMYMTLDERNKTVLAGVLTLLGLLIKRKILSFGKKKSVKFKKKSRKK